MVVSARSMRCKSRQARSVRWPYKIQTADPHATSHPSRSMTMSLLDAHWTITKARLQGFLLVWGGVAAYQTTRDYFYPPPPEEVNETDECDVSEQGGEVTVRLVDRGPEPSPLVDTEHVQARLV